MVRLPFPGPAELLRITERGYEAIEQAIALVPRLATLLDRVEQLVDRADQAIEAVDETRKRADALVAGVDQTRERADELVARTGAVVDTAQALVAQAEQLIGRGGQLRDAFEPSLQRLAPIAARLSESTSQAEVDAVVQLIDSLPHLVTSLDQDILPILGTLNTVAPDVRDLLNTMMEFNEILGSVPGLGRIKKRVEERQEAEDRDQAAVPTVTTY
jgi:ABC-type transporter Mla subunit MlaD